LGGRRRKERGREEEGRGGERRGRKGEGEEGEEKKREGGRERTERGSQHTKCRQGKFILLCVLTLLIRHSLENSSIHTIETLGRNSIQEFPSCATDD
jgi:hypothetical protein